MQVIDLFIDFKLHINHYLVQVTAKFEVQKKNSYTLKQRYYIHDNSKFN